MRYLPWRFEIIQFSRLNPESKENPNDHSEILHRFYGITKEGQIFTYKSKKEKKREKMVYFRISRNGLKQKDPPPRVVYEPRPKDLFLTILYIFTYGMSIA